VQNAARDILHIRSRSGSEPARIMRLIVITGSMGAGKTTVMAEASDLLAARGVVHAAIDLDELGIAHLGARHDDDLPYRNLESVWHNYREAGIDALLLAAAVVSRAELERIRGALRATRMVVCRLRAPLEAMQSRIRAREPGMLQGQFVARAAALDEMLDAASLEDFAVVNDGRPVTDVAREMLVGAGWLSI